MATGKKMWYTRTTTNFFDFDAPGGVLLRRQGGANYLAVYMMFCAKTANTDGRLETRIGKLVEPLDLNGIRQLLVYFSQDTIKNAIEILRALELLDVDESGTLYVTNYKDICGYKTDYAEQKAAQRAALKAASGQREIADKCMDNAVDIVHTYVSDNVALIEEEYKDYSTRVNNSEQIVNIKKPLSPLSLLLDSAMREKEKEFNALSNFDKLAYENDVEVTADRYPAIKITSAEYFAVTEMVDPDWVIYYFEVVQNAEKRGKKYKLTTHAKAIISMAIKDGHESEFCRRILEAAQKNAVEIVRMKK